MKLASSALAKPFGNKAFAFIGVDNAAIYWFCALLALFLLARILRYVPPLFPLVASTKCQPAPGAAMANCY
jgi:hypothetical protein